MTKKEARKLAIKKRKTLDPNQINDLSKKCLNIFLENFEIQNKNVGIFLPIEKQNEPNTYSLLDNLNSRFFAPRVNIENNSMEFYRIKSKDDILLGPYEIPQPISNEFIAKENIDLMLIPLLAFDLKGNRVGYGNGYYDKYLAYVPSSLIKIGISFFDSLDLISDTNEDDIRLDYCITPEKIICFKHES